MQTKHIEKLEELIGEKWGYKNGYFKIEKVSLDDVINLYQKNFKFITGEVGNIMIRPISLKNLSELEFYGLKVVLNEKPKLTREEREYIEAEWYIARDKDNKLFLYHIHPNRNEEDEEWEPSIGSRACAIDINRTLFPFITWESGKAWSKSELMELEVIE